MPIFDYVCSSCNSVWDEFKKIDNRKEPEALPCPKCGKIGSVAQSIVHSPVAMSYTLEASRAIKKLNNASALKERIQQIHDRTPGSQLNKTSTILDIK